MIVKQINLESTFGLPGLVSNKKCVDLTNVIVTPSHFLPDDISKKIIVSTICARVISSLYNYLVNAKIVFKRSFITVSACLDSSVLLAKSPLGLTNISGCSANKNLASLFIRL